MRTPVACTTVTILMFAGACSDPPSGSATYGPATSAPAPTGAAVSSAECNAGISTEALPVWAREGFNFDGSGVPHRLGDQGGLMAILFAPPKADPVDGTKILWVSRLPVETAAPLTVSGVRSDGLTATQELPNGAGPSAVKIPEPGCWDLTLTWSGHTDRMRLWFTG
ncbi:hypothetical protein GCM10010168_58500 [Actinoplanes ianthinogenes]|uniref:Lipoprotein n=1 Tax=Actinoplanes ianthinogenes TaxID=122358 RepID=A0ABM7M254_9ACTN|nr:hypothetical protein [Actinoplanes ianthinogenes]BCJ45730.1 hypothetical protein Aiant_63870 [Actinoplanes ianthinogenes]GGR32350.1 hypothetical protein GCM10010168_58500 [Actinoplanes ianthinogenes]